MSLRVIVTSEEGPPRLDFEGREAIQMLGSQYEGIALQLSELVISVSKSLRQAIDSESELSVELSGVVELKASAGIQYLIFNIGGEATKSNTMKVTLKTKVSPVK